MTLPLIKLVQSDGNARSMLENIMEEGEYQNGTRAEIGKVLQRFSILESTRKIALEYGEAARKSLDVLPETGYRSALEAIPDFVVKRKK